MAAIRPARDVRASDTLVKVSTATSTARATVRPASVVLASRNACYQVGCDCELQHRIAKAASMSDLNAQFKTSLQVETPVSASTSPETSTAKATERPARDFPRQR